MILFHDLETFSEVPINCGTYAYAEGAEIMIESWAIDDGPVHVTDRTAGDLGPFDLFDVDDFEWVVYHGGAGPTFDRVVQDACGVHIPPEKVWDTAVQARSHGLPGGLDKLCTIFKVPEALAKHGDGKKLIQLFCKPRPKNIKLRRATRASHPIEWQRFLDYAGGDIHAMRYLFGVLPRWNYPTREHKLWCLDQKINERGFKVDLDLANAAIAMIADEKVDVDARTDAATEGRIRSTTQRDKLLKELLIEHGVSLPDMTGDTIERRLEDENLPEPVKDLLRQRLLTSSTSTSKYKKIISAVSEDGRMRGSLLFCGAPRTKRWSGKIFQPQNLPRPDMDADEIDAGIELMKAGRVDQILEPMRLGWNAIRGLIIADEGRKLVQADLSGIEARVLPWLAGEEWKLDVFRNHDLGVGPGAYEATAARLLGIPVEEVTKDQRQSHGKVVELACLGPHTRVLTNHGVKVITAVTQNDLLWDGAEWVKHEGLIDRGEKLTIRLDGIEITPDHEVWLGQWSPAWVAASCPSILQSMLATASASLPSFAQIEDQRVVCRSSGSSALAAQTLTLSTSTTFDAEQPLAVSVAVAQRSDPPLKSGSNMKLSSQTSSIADVFAAVCQPASTAATIRKTKRSSTTEGGAFSSLPSGAKTVAYSSHIWSRLRVGINRFLNSTGSTTTKDMSQETCASSPSRGTTSTDGASPNSPLGSLSLSATYDIANAGPRNRFTVLTDSGALIVHNCGYGGAAGAFAQFAALYRVDMEPHEVMEAVRGWREAHAAIADWGDGFWALLDKAARNAILQPGVEFKAGEHISFFRKGSWLVMKLPSGGFLSYAFPAIVPDPRRPGNDAISFMGINSYTRRWERIYTYGGKLSADATQATARELIAENMEHAEAEGFPIILTVHDELITEPLDDPHQSVKRLIEALTRRPKWIDDRLPLAAGGFEAMRYRKD